MVLIHVKEQVIILDDMVVRARVVDKLVYLTVQAFRVAVWRFENVAKLAIISVCCQSVTECLLQVDVGVQTVSRRVIVILLQAHIEPPHVPYVWVTADSGIVRDAPTALIAKLVRAASQPMSDHRVPSGANG